ncbi:MAG: hypothetical protein JO034_18115, partial [Singulisphaera sp.]|nr:hypothetical protein [Singulisphaera sp.]
MKTKLAPLDAIRVETALARLPIHRLAKQGSISIELREGDERGAATLIWRVSHNSEHGQPGPLAYKTDTVVINRKLELAGRPAPELIRLGSLREIAEATGTGEGNIMLVKRALLQNAGAFITAKIKYRSADGREVELDANFTRYEVHFAGERLPDGRKADAVYLVLGATYRRILDTALSRPLDFTYLRALPPIAQRWYELASFTLFGALKHRRPTARLAYSEFCLHAPQARCTESGPMRKQMARVHAPHLESGYLADVTFEATTDREGRPDWMMAYTPGPKARAEYRAFTGKGRPVLLDVPPTPSRPEPEPKPTGLVLELVERGVTQAVAADLVRDFPEDRLRRQVEVVDWLRETKPKRVKDLGAYLADAIRKDFAAPAGFRSRAERAAAAATARAEQDQQEQARRATARAQAERDRVRAYWEALPPERQAALEA